MIVKNISVLTNIVSIIDDGQDVNPPTLNKLKKAIRKLKNSKAAGIEETR